MDRTVQNHRPIEHTNLPETRQIMTKNISSYIFKRAKKGKVRMTETFCYPSKSILSADHQNVETRVRHVSNLRRSSSEAAS